MWSRLMRSIAPLSANRPLKESGPQPVLDVPAPGIHLPFFPVVYSALHQKKVPFEELFPVFVTSSLIYLAPLRNTALAQGALGKTRKYIEGRRKDDGQGLADE